MAVLSDSSGNQGVFEQYQPREDARSQPAIGWWGKYRQTILFAATALVVMAIATFFAATKVNGVIAGLAERQVVELAEENTTRDALHIQSMVRDNQGLTAVSAEHMEHGHSMDDPGHDMGEMAGVAESDGMAGMTHSAGMAEMEDTDVMAGMTHSAGMAEMEDTDGMAGMAESSMLTPGASLTLEALTRPGGLPAHFSSLVEGLGVVEASLFDDVGTVVWSTNSVAVGLAETGNAQIERAVDGTISSKLAKNEEVVGLDGAPQRMDVVKTYVPIQDSPSAPVIGVLEMHREVGADLGLLVDDTKSTVIWTTVTTMAGLFLALVGFVVVSDRSIFRSHQRQIAMVEERLAERTDAERKISEHALALEVSNRELEAFSYSVSHDLRSPLRTIDGFSKALIEDYEDKLDQDGVTALEKVRSGTQRMGILIDAMLQMSRVSRGEIRRDDVDISGMVRGMAAEYNTAEPERQVEFVIQDGMTEHCDPNLIRGVYQNLLANSWKFTSKHPTGRIEVGAMLHEGKTTYFVRDDGAGFDMEYSSKLFGAFQRLHGMTEFEGTGVGLATAQRVVHRHGGRIWAEGEVEKGATVYFTLSPSYRHDTQTEEEQRGQRNNHARRG